MIQLNQVSLEFADRVLFDDVTLNLTKKYRYIVVGANGAGKSSFLRMLAGELEATLGTITIAKASRMGWLRQDHHLYDHLSLIDVVIKGREPLWNALHEKHELLESDEWDESHSDKLSKLEERIAGLDGYRASADAAAILIGLGMGPELHSKKLKQFSGGWKMRALLAQQLFNNPDILLLDEPTNYLDITSISWLDKYLTTTYQGLVLLVSHDQKFLEDIGTCVLDVDFGQIIAYPGSYKNFLKKKVEMEEQKAKEYSLTEYRVEKMQRFVERFKNKPSKAKQASSRQKMIEKVKWPELGRSSRRIPTFHFPMGKVTGQIVMKALGLCKIYDPDILIGPFNLEILRGERIAFIGENGAGKTTLIKMLTNQIDPDEGVLEPGPRLEIAIFHQEHKHLFTGDETVHSWLAHNVTATEEKERQILGQVLFKPDDLRKKITMLSGGEMARLLLAKIMLSKANLLVLDEPTNHLDLESRQALEEGLIKFPGTVLFVSHDRYFVDKVATRVIEVHRDLL